MFLNHRATAALALVGSLLNSFSGVTHDASSSRPTPGIPSVGALSRTYGELPMSFQANEGQTDAQVQFLSRGRGYALFLTSTEAVLSLRDGRKRGPKHTPSACAAVRMTLEGAAPGTHAEGVNRLPGTVNYFVGNDPDKWRTGIASYTKVKYPGIYPGIDLVYYGNQHELEFDFIVAPGADPRAIALNFEGADRLEIGNDGELLLRLGQRTVTWHRPVVYQEVDGQRREIVCRYVSKDNHRVAFEVDGYDSTRPLIIDPVMVYSTFLGGQDFDAAESIAVNASGQAFVCGETASIDFPTRFPVDGSLGGASDAFVTKFNVPGAAVIFSTYLGGGGEDFGLAVAVDRNNLVYVTGQTDSSNFPRVNAYQSTLSGGLDAFVSKLGVAGTNLLYSTYFGGNGFEIGNGIAVDAGGNAYVVGETDSGPNFPRKNPFQNNSGGFLDAFVARFNTATSGSASLVYASWLGGFDDERATDVMLDSSTNVYLCGQIFTPDMDVSDFPVHNALQPNFGGGFQDAFVAKLSAGASPTVLFATFLGGANEDLANAMTLDSANNIYVTGQTSSTNFPTLNAMQPVIGGNETFFTYDVFVTKINSAGTAMLYSTYLGGDLDDDGQGIAVDATGNIYVAGRTESSNFPITDGADQNIDGGGASDAFVSKFNPAFPGPSALIYSTYLGGLDEDFATGLALDPTDAFYVTGQTSSENFLATAATFQTNYAGLSDAFITKYSSPSDLSIATITDPESPVLGSNLTYTIRVNNNGRSSFSGVMLSDPLPPALDYVTSSTTRGNCTFNAGTATLTCNFGIMASNASATVTLVVRTRVDGSATNIIRLTANEPENNRGNNTNAVVTRIRSLPDLTLTQVATPDPVFVGSNLVYNLEVRNKGPGLAREVTVTNRLPSTVIYSSATTSQGNCFPISNTVVCVLGDLPDGASNTIAIVVSPQSAGSITSTANVNTFDFDPIPNNNVAVTTTTVLGMGLDVSISSVVAPTTVFASSNLTYTLTVSNAGPSTAMNVVVTNTLPATVNFLSATTTQGTCSNAGGVVTCRLNSLPNRGSVAIMIQAKTTIDGLVTNEATVTASQADSNPGNNVTTAVATVNPQADVSVITFGSPDPVTVSNKLSYLIYVNNAGPSTATGLLVTDFLPNDMIFIAATNTHGTADFQDGVVFSSIPSLPKGDRATITIMVTPPYMQGMLTNATSVTLSQRDPILRNNFYTFISRVSILPALAIRPAGTNVVLSWPTSTGPFNLESATSLNPANWQAVTNVPAIIDSQNVVTQRMSSPLRVYRLIK